MKKLGFLGLIVALSAGVSSLGHTRNIPVPSDDSLFVFDPSNTKEAVRKLHQYNPLLCKDPTDAKAYEEIHPRLLESFTTGAPVEIDPAQELENKADGFSRVQLSEVEGYVAKPSLKERVVEEIYEAGGYAKKNAGPFARFLGRTTGWLSGLAAECSGKISQWFGKGLTSLGGQIWDQGGVVWDDGFKTAKKMWADKKEGRAIAEGLKTIALSGTLRALGGLTAASSFLVLEKFGYGLEATGKSLQEYCS